MTHRFQEPLQDGNIDNFFTLDTGNTWGFGLWYAPLKNLNLGFYRSSDLATYEASGQYELPRLGCFASSLRFGADWRTTGARPQSSLWAQAVLAYDFGKYVRITAVPTYLQRTNGDLGNFGGLPPFLPEPPHDLSCRPTGLPPELPQFTCSGLYENIFNVPVGASIAITHSITVHGEVYPRLSKVDAGGVGWAVTVEKSLLRHRFAFFAGNVKGTTVGQYAIAVPYAQPSEERLHRLQSLPGLEAEMTRGRGRAPRHFIPRAIGPRDPESTVPAETASRWRVTNRWRTMRLAWPPPSPRSPSPARRDRPPRRRSRP